MQALEANKGTYHSFSSPMIEGQSEEGKKNQLETYLITFPWSFKWEFYMTSHKLCEILLQNVSFINLEDEDILYKIFQENI